MGQDRALNAIRFGLELDKPGYNRGYAYTFLGEYQRAIEDYDEAIRLGFQHALAYANRAGAYALQGRDSEAQKDVERAVELGFDRDTLENDIEERKKQR